jgi:RNA polymerase sigma-70 factor (ECF subfamily)
VPLDAEHHEVPAPDNDEDLGAHGLLVAFMSELDPLDRALLVLYLEERSYREMAEILGISDTNVSTKINRLKQRVRRFGEAHGAR